jgi:hypothetical protein
MQVSAEGFEQASGAREAADDEECAVRGIEFP